MSKRSVYMPMEPMSRYTSSRIGGPAELFACLAVEKDLVKVLCIRRESRVLWRVLRGGSNLLVSDKGCESVVISTKQLGELEVNGNLLWAGVGQLLGRAAHPALEHPLTGTELAAGIPGSADDTLVMNAGAYGSEIKDILKSSRVTIGEDRILSLLAGGLELGYRISCIPPRGYIVLEAIYELRPGDRGAIEERMRELATRRRGKQSLEYPSAGSAFKRPQGYFIGKLIGDAGLGEYQVGGAWVSEKHCGFVISRDHAIADHVMELCNHIRRTVKEIFGMELEMEVERRGES